MTDTYTASNAFAEVLGFDSPDDLLGAQIGIEMFNDTSVSYARFRLIGQTDDAILWLGVIDEASGVPACIPWHAIATVAVLDEPDDHT